MFSAVIYSCIVSGVGRDLADAEFAFSQLMQQGVCYRIGALSCLFKEIQNLVLDSLLGGPEFDGDGEGFHVAFVRSVSCNREINLV